MPREGDGEMRSNYGLKTYTPEETKNQWRESVEHMKVSTYDRLFHVKQGYHSKLRRDDREHTLELNIHSEERNKMVPILSSTAYGHRRPLETAPGKHTWVALIQRDFYRNCGTNIPTGVPNEREPDL